MTTLWSALCGQAVGNFKFIPVLAKFEIHPHHSFPVDSATYEIYTVLAAGAERGSKPVTVTRPV